MKKFFFLPVLLALCLPAAAQKLSPADQQLLQLIEKEIRSRAPQICVNGECFRTQAEALAYCAGAAEAVTSAKSIPEQFQPVLEDTLNTCATLMQTPPQQCVAPEALAKTYELGKKTFWKSVANSFQKGYQTMAEGYTKVDYIDGYRQIGKALGENFKEGYQTMAEGYTKVDYIDGYRQIGKALGENFKEGYQTMAEGYTKVDYIDGYRQLWQIIKNFFKEGCRLQTKTETEMWKNFGKKHQ